jgi:hypothetical protein
VLAWASTLSSIGLEVSAAQGQYQWNIGLCKKDELSSLGFLFYD